MKATNNTIYFSRPPKTLVTSWIPKGRQFQTSPHTFTTLSRVKTSFKPNYKTTQLNFNFLKVSNINLQFRKTQCTEAYSKINKEAREKTENFNKNEAEAITTKAIPANSPEGVNTQYVNGEEYTLKHPIWNNYEVNEVIVEKHRKPVTFTDYLAKTLVKIMKTNFDIMSGFVFGNRTPNKWLTRIIFLETVAGVPGSIGGTMRHLSSLRKLKRDHGWIHTLLEEAENERLHLLTALELKNPTLPFRFFVMVTQGIFYNFFFFSYLLSSKFCHRFVGYLEEEAVKTYTRCLADIDDPTNETSVWNQTPAPLVAKNYWKLKDNATMRDVILVIRADEAHHRDVNHTFGNMNSDDVNPFGLGR